VELRKSLSDQGFDGGPQTIQYHLAQRRRRSRSHRPLPSVATIWRVLSRRGFVVSEPHKRPRSSWRRFQADLPNECWQADTAHVLIPHGRDVEVLNILDDNSRLLVASRAFKTTKAVDVVDTFHQAAAEYGLPASVLTTQWRDLHRRSPQRTLRDGKRATGSRHHHKHGSEGLSPADCRPKGHTGVPPILKTELRIRKRYSRTRQTVGLCRSYLYRSSLRWQPVRISVAACSG
jgi:hypothetical protein